MEIFKLDVCSVIRQKTPKRLINSGFRDRVVSPIDRSWGFRDAFHEVSIADLNKSGPERWPTLGASSLKTYFYCRWTPWWNFEDYLFLELSISDIDYERYCILPYFRWKIGVSSRKADNWRKSSESSFLVKCGWIDSTYADQPPDCHPPCRRHSKSNFDFGSFKYQPTKRGGIIFADNWKMNSWKRSIYVCQW